MDVTHTEYSIEQASEPSLVSDVAVSYNKTAYENDYVTDYEIDRQKPMPSKLHARVQGNIYFEIRKSYHNYDVYPELTFELLGKKAVPDLSLLHVETVDYIQDEIKVTTVPLLVVEILSPRQNIEEIKEKIKDIYLPAGLKSIWMVIPPLKTVSLVLPNGQFQTITEGVVKDLYLDVQLNMSDIFK